ncbi:MAG: hypothetical protein KA419_01240 [Acidobacteria bacterium]|nr:hypothetical protein [Acidobacteriota bacterium]
MEELVQVACALEGEDTRRREIKALTEAAEELGASRLTILAGQGSERVPSGDRSIEVVPLLNGGKQFLPVEGPGFGHLPRFHFS